MSTLHYLANFARQYAHNVGNKLVVMYRVAFADDDKFVAVLYQKIDKQFGNFLHAFAFEGKLVFQSRFDVFHKGRNDGKVKSFLVGEISVHIAEADLGIVGNVSDGRVCVAVFLELFYGGVQYSLPYFLLKVLH